MSTSKAAALALAVTAAACNGSSTGSTSAHDASTHHDAPSAVDALSPVDAGSDSGTCGTPPPGACPLGSLVCTSNGWACSKSSACVGLTPTCFGSNDVTCCRDDPLGLATCALGLWMCGDAGAPGCNGNPCISYADASGFDAGHTPCGTRVDGGSEQFGVCPAPELCCDGPLSPSFYCYAGDGGCPSLQ